MEEKIDRIPFKDLLVKVNDHLEFSPIVIGILKFIDLSSLSLKNVKVDCIDFRGCNISLPNPSVVYNKFLRNCNFEGVYFSPFTIFSGVDIRGCKFSDDRDEMTPDILPSFTGAIYDETTTYNGIPLKIILEEKTKKNNKKEIISDLFYYLQIML